MANSAVSSVVERALESIRKVDKSAQQEALDGAPNERRVSGTELAALKDHTVRLTSD